MKIKIVTIILTALLLSNTAFAQKKTEPKQSAVNKTINFNEKAFLEGLKKLTPKHKQNGAAIVEDIEKFLKDLPTEDASPPGCFKGQKGILCSSAFVDACGLREPELCIYLAKNRFGTSRAAENPYKYNTLWYLSLLYPYNPSLKQDYVDTIIALKKQHPKDFEDMLLDKEATTLLHSMPHDFPKGGPNALKDYDGAKTESFQSLFVQTAYSEGNSFCHHMKMPDEKTKMTPLYIAILMKNKNAFYTYVSTLKTRCSFNDIKEIAEMPQGTDKSDNVIDHALTNYEKKDTFYTDVLATAGIVIPTEEIQGRLNKMRERFKFSLDNPLLSGANTQEKQAHTIKGASLANLDGKAVSLKEAMATGIHSSSVSATDPDNIKLAKESVPPSIISEAQKYENIKAFYPPYSKEYMDAKKQKDKLLDDAKNPFSLMDTRNSKAAIDAWEALTPATKSASTQNARVEMQNYYALKSRAEDTQKLADATQREIDNLRNNTGLLDKWFNKDYKNKLAALETQKAAQEDELALTHTAMQTSKRRLIEDMGPNLTEQDFNNLPYWAGGEQTPSTARQQESMAYKQFRLKDQLSKTKNPQERAYLEGQIQQNGYALVENMTQNGVLKPESPTYNAADSAQARAARAKEMRDRYNKSLAQAEKDKEAYLEKINTPGYDQASPKKQGRIIIGGDGRAMRIKADQLLRSGNTQEALDLYTQAAYLGDQDAKNTLTIRLGSEDRAQEAIARFAKNINNPI